MIKGFLIIKAKDHVGGGEIYAQIIAKSLNYQTNTVIEYGKTSSIAKLLLFKRYKKIIWIVNDDIPLLLLFLSVLKGNTNIYLSLNIWYNNLLLITKNSYLGKIKLFIIRNWFWLKQQSFFLLCADIIHLSEYAKKEAVRHFHFIPYKHNYVIYGGADKKYFFPVSINIKRKLRKQHGIDTKTKILLMTGRIDRRKNYLDGLKVLSELKKISSKNWKLLFVFSFGKYGNDFSYLNDIFSEINRLGLHKNVLIISGVTHQKISEYFKIADIFLMLSLNNETFGLVTLEALYTGIPVFGYASCATPEIVPSPKLYLAKTYDYNRVASLINMYKKNKIDIEAVLSKFSWENTLTLLQQAL